MTGVRMRPLRPPRSKKRATRSATSAESSLDTNNDSADRPATLRISAHGDNAHVAIVQLNGGPCERESIRTDWEVANIAARVLCLNPCFVHVYIETTIARFDALIEALARARASARVHLEGLAYTSHADNSRARAALIQNGFVEETPAQFVRHFDANPGRE